MALFSALRLFLVASALNTLLGEISLIFTLYLHFFLSLCLYRCPHCDFACEVPGGQDKVFSCQNPACMKVSKSK